MRLDDGRFTTIKISYTTSCHVVMCLMEDCFERTVRDSQSYLFGHLRERKREWEKK